MKKQLITLMGLTALTVSLSTQAAIISGYGVEASTSTASNCPSYCTTAGGGDFQYNSAGAEFSTTANASENSYASADAYASLSGSTFLPILKVKSSAADGKGGFASAFGVQGFTYTGTTEFEFTLNYNLHGSAGLNPTGSTNRSNQLSASIAVLIGTDLEWYPDFGTLVYEVAYNQTRAGTDLLSIYNGENVNDFGSISFLLNPGDEFYVVGEMTANAINGYADGWNTLTFDFTDNTGLTAVSAVPVPAAVWLFASGMIGLAGVARRKKA